MDNYQWGTSFAQQALLFKNVRSAKDGKITFERVAAAPDSGLAKANAARGLAVADFDNDGRLDAVVAVMDGAPMLLRNVAETKNNWLEIKLVGDKSKKTPLDAVGSCVFVTTGKTRQRYDLTSGASYASQSSQIIHVGLGDAAKIDALEIVWSNGQTEKFSVEKINSLITIKQGSSEKN